MDRAHRALRPPQQNGPPRAMIAHLDHYRTKELILRLSWERAGQLTYRGQKISFYPDLSIDLVRRRAVFNPVKKQLQEAGVKYSLAYPATLWLTLNRSKHEFKSPCGFPDSKSFWLFCGIYLASLGLFWQRIIFVGQVWFCYDLP